MEDKQICVIPNLETMKEGMVKAKHFDDAAVISDVLKHIRGFEANLDKYVRKNTELIDTIKILADQENVKEDNLLNFHSANILQGLLNSRGDIASDNDITHRAISLAKTMIVKIKEENKARGER